jgi:hypothetical protein
MGYNFAVELEDPSIEFTPTTDRRPLIPEPLPVRLLTVEDASLCAASGLEVLLDDFYVLLLKFERDADSYDLIYHADNFSLHFQIIEKFPERQSLRPLMIEVPRLSEIEQQLIDRQLEYTRQRGLTPGEERLVLQDPAGNWIEIVEYKPV